MSANYRSPAPSKEKLRQLHVMFRHYLQLIRGKIFSHTGVDTVKSVTSNVSGKLLCVLSKQRIRGESWGIECLPLHVRKLAVVRVTVPGRGVLSRSPSFSRWRNWSKSACWHSALNCDNAVEPIIGEIGVGGGNEPSPSQTRCTVPLVFFPLPHAPGLANNLANTQRGQTSHNNPPPLPHSYRTLHSYLATDRP